MVRLRMGVRVEMFVKMRKNCEQGNEGPKGKKHGRDASPGARPTRM